MGDIAGTQCLEEILPLVLYGEESGEKEHEIVG